MSARPRPLSPHLQIYHFSITMTMSIVHRITGAALYAGSVLLAVWLAAAAFSPEAFELVNMVYGSWFGLLVLFGYTWALFHHMMGGLRHFVWDLGHGFAPGQREALAWFGLAASLVLTLGAWAGFFWLG